MARVPSVSPVRAGDIRASKTTLPRITEARGLDVGARALSKLGQTISGEGEKLAQLGIVEARKDEAREVQARTIRFKQDLFDLTYGNKDKNITGYLETKGQNALDNSAAHREKVEELRRKNSSEITNPNVQAGFKATSENEREASFVTHANYLVQQRQVAQNATDAAHLQALYNEVMANPFDPLNAARKIQAVDLTLEMADRAGITDETARQNLVMSNLTGMHTGAITKLLNEGRAAEAAAYFQNVKSEILPTSRGEISKSIRTGTITAQAQTEFDDIINDPVGLATDKERLAAAREIENAEVREKVVAMVRAHNIDKGKQEADQDKSLRASAVQKAQAGRNPDTDLTVPEQQAVAQRPGMFDTLRKIAQRQLAGRPFLSNPEVRGNLFKLRRTDPEKFLEADLDLPPYVGGLSEADRKVFQNQQLAMDRDVARKQSANQKELERGSRLSRALRATRPLVKGLNLTDEEEGNLSIALSEEIERRTAEGEKLTDTMYQDIVRGLMLQGEHTDSGFFEDDNATLFEAIAGDLPFDIEDFAGKNEALVERLAKSAGIEVDDATIVIELLANAKIVPTPDAVRREFNRQKAALEGGR